MSSPSPVTCCVDCSQDNNLCAVLPLHLRTPHDVPMHPCSSSCPSKHGQGFSPPPKRITTNHHESPRINHESTTNHPLPPLSAPFFFSLWLKVAYASSLVGRAGQINQPCTQPVGFRPALRFFSFLPLPYHFCLPLPFPPSSKLFEFHLIFIPFTEH